MFFSFGRFCLLVQFFEKAIEGYLSFIYLQHILLLALRWYLPSDCNKIDFEENGTVHRFSIYCENFYIITKFLKPLIF